MKYIPHGECSKCGGKLVVPVTTLIAWEGPIHLETESDFCPVEQEPQQAEVLQFAKKSNDTKRDEN